MDKDLKSRLVRGDPEAAAECERNAVRLFVSSTFTDTKTERNYLMRTVYPGIRKLCNDHGVEFSIVDLRWGIRDEATNDHMTTEICLSEINKCIKSTIVGAPCFVYLAFNRYGSPPLPRLVTAQEMDLLLPLVAKSKAKVKITSGKEKSVADVIRAWYRKDDNACPEVYTLQPISTHHPDFVTTKDDKVRRTIRNDWYTLSGHMLKALGSAANQSPAITPQQQSKYVISTTHDEVNNGILATEELKNSSLSYCRDFIEFEKITDKVDESFGSNVWRYMDVDDENNVIKDAQRRQKELRQEVKAHGVPTREYSVNWNVTEVSKADKKVKEGVLSEESHPEYVKKMASEVKTDLTTKIKDAISKRPKLDTMTSEVVSHVTFCSRKAASFYGRENMVATAMNYYTGNEGRVNSARSRSGNDLETVFVVHGVSGSGKTSLMAKIVSSVRKMFQEKKTSPVMVTRFCGTSGASSSAKNLLFSMCQQIDQIYPPVKDNRNSNFKAATDGVVPVPSAFKDLGPHFAALLKRVTPDKPLVIHIDSLDQLSDEDNGRSKLDWLPFDLPPNVYLMVSTLPDVGGCLEFLKQKSIPPSNFLEVGKLTKDDVGLIFTGWLNENKRTLQKAQFEFVHKIALDESKEQPTPLRLRLLSDIALKWTSYDKVPSTLPSTVEGLIETIFTSLEKVHGEILMSAFCGLLAASKRGISENDLVDILSTDDTVLDSVLQYHKPPVKRLPYHLVARLKYDLRNYLVDRGEYNKTVVYWFHRQFWQCAEKRYLKIGTPEEESIRDRFSLLLIKYFSEEVHSSYKEKQDRGLTEQPVFYKSGNGDINFNLVRLSELPHAVSKGSKKLHELYKHSLGNLGFIAAKCAAGKATELASDYDMALKICSDKKLKLYSKFLRENTHILNKDPSVIVQQLLNASDSMKDIQSDLNSNEAAKILPWLEAKNIPVSCELVNKASGDNPILLTIPGDPPAPEYSSTRNTYNCITNATLGKRTYVVVAYRVDNSSFEHKNEGGHFFNIYDASSGAMLLKLKVGGPKDGSIGKLGTIPNDSKSFCILYHMNKMSYDDNQAMCSKVFFKVVSVGETLMALDGPNLPMLLEPEKDIGSGVYSTWDLSHNNEMLVTLTLKEIRSETDLFGRKRDGPEPVPQTALKSWDIRACLKAKKEETKTPICSKAGDMVISEGLENIKKKIPEATVQNIQHRLCFSPDDKYLVFPVTVKDRHNHNQSYLTILNSTSLEHVWSFKHNNQVFYNFWNITTCPIPEYPDSWLIIWDGGVSCGIVSLVMQNQGSEVGGFLGWSSHALKSVHSVSAFTTPSKSIHIVGCIEDVLHIWKIPAQTLKKHGVPPTKLISCKRIEDLPLMQHFGGRHLIGTTITSLYISDMVCFTLAKNGEVKITDMKTLNKYKQTDKVDRPIKVCCLSEDCSSLVVAGGPMIACFDADTGDLKSTVTTMRSTRARAHRIRHVVPYSKDLIYAKTGSDEDGYFGVVEMEIFGQANSNYQFDNKAGVFTLTQYSGKTEKEYTLDTEDKDEQKSKRDLTVSSDRKWICRPSVEKKSPFAIDDQMKDEETPSGVIPSHGYKPGSIKSSLNGASGVDTTPSTKNPSEPTIDSAKSSLFSGTTGSESLSSDSNLSQGRTATSNSISQSSPLGKLKEPRKGSPLNSPSGTGGRSLGSRSDVTQGRGLQSRSRGAKGPPPQSAPGDDPSLYRNSLQVNLVNTETGKATDVVIHRFENGRTFKIESFRSNYYRGAFSHSGKYFAAWGDLTFTCYNEQVNKFKAYVPPCIKLYEFGKNLDLKELKQLEHRRLCDDKTKEESKGMNSLFFLPEDKYLLSTTSQGRVQIRGPLPELSVSKEHVTDDVTFVDCHMINSSANHFLVTCAEDRCVRIWKITQNPPDISYIGRYHNPSNITSICGFMNEKEKSLYTYFGDESGSIKILKIKV